MPIHDRRRLVGSVGEVFTQHLMKKRRERHPARLLHNRDRRLWRSRWPIGALEDVVEEMLNPDVDNASLANVEAFLAFHDLDRLLIVEPTQARLPRYFRLLARLEFALDAREDLFALIERLTVVLVAHAVHFVLDGRDVGKMTCHY